MIDIKLFKEMYQEIDAMVQKIRLLPMVRNQEQYYIGWEYDDETESITIESNYDWGNCGGIDVSYLEIPLSEINNSVEWFKEKFQKEIDEVKKMQLEYAKEEKARVKGNREKIKKNKENADMATYRRIKKQLENYKL